MWRDSETYEKHCLLLLQHNFPTGVISLVLEQQIEVSPQQCSTVHDRSVLMAVVVKDHVKLYPPKACGKLTYALY